MSDHAPEHLNQRPRDEAWGKRADELAEQWCSLRPEWRAARPTRGNDMAVGPGKYHDLCTKVRESAHAQGAVVVVVGGQKGDGFSVQGPLALLRRLPALLEVTAAQIRRDLPPEHRG